ncbi:Protein tramtrack, alpha isoform [Trachymyrmex septentrionalis]|uniref:Protein tramtrack, alpha isoform n=1 Tax=Trachymyrmex septentrionalis TaxID=34720 RepID=A0A151JX49_9HYME|nr:PREDICTED: broad-complex core protein isoforms 1/2/3/4/5-like [Trachymyrmex septentrionalis]KYN38967.1 Protein tramtrack, alpha isoform [Trachymyrmex septentrionalis]
MDIMSASQQYCLRWNNHRSNLLNSFEELLHNAAFTDVTLAVEDGRTVKCHKIVLAACSTYFQTLFHQLSSYNHHPIIVLKDVGMPEIKAILEYMYRGEVNVAHEQLPDLLKIAQVLKVKGLVEEHGSNTSNTPHDLRSEGTSVSPPPDISTSTSTGGGGGASHSSPPSYYSLYGNSASDARDSSHLASSLPTWPLLHSTGHPVLPKSLSSILGGGSGNSGGSYDNVIETSPFIKRRKLPQPPSGLLINNDTPILRTVLGQAHVDSSQAVLPLLQPDSHEPVSYRNANSNGSTNDSDNRRSNDLAHGETTVHADASYADEDERQPSPQSYPDTARNSAAADCVQPKPEWKRYKQYTRDDISAAIEAVRKGMSAVQAARKYGVPSRTLYDKVKKLGIPTSRPFKRSASNGGSGACFPYGIGANVNGALYDNNASSANALSENENESNVNAPEGLAGTSAAIFDATYAKAKDSSRDRGDSIPDSMARCSSSPVIRCAKQRQQQQQQQNLDEVEDLSVSRKSDVPVIVPPSTTSTTIKDEAQETGLDSNDCCDYS